MSTPRATPRRSPPPPRRPRPQLPSTPPPPPPPPQVFQSIDVDNSKSIDEDEFKAAFHRLTAEADSMVRAHQMKNKLRGVFAANVFKAGLGKDKLPESFKKPPTIECCREQAGSRGSKQLVLKWWRGDAESWVVQWTCTSWKAPLEIRCDEPICRMSANPTPRCARAWRCATTTAASACSQLEEARLRLGPRRGRQAGGVTARRKHRRAAGGGGARARRAGGARERRRRRPSTAPSSTSVGATRYYSGGASAWLETRRRALAAHRRARAGPRAAAPATTTSRSRSTRAATCARRR